MVSFGSHSMSSERLTMKSTSNLALDAETLGRVKLTPAWIMISKFCYGWQGASRGMQVNATPGLVATIGRRGRQLT